MNALSSARTNPFRPTFAAPAVMAKLRSDNVIRRERLTNLIRVVDNVPSHKFDMSLYLHYCPIYGHQIGCAAGWAALDEWFQIEARAEGIPWTTDWVGPSGEIIWYPRPDHLAFAERYMPEQPSFFRISLADALHLFMPTLGGLGRTSNGRMSAITRHMVIENVYRLLDGKSALPYRT